MEEGQLSPPVVKGPLTVTDIVCWHVGVGMWYYGVKALRLGYENRLISSEAVMSANHP